MVAHNRSSTLAATWPAYALRTMLLLLLWLGVARAHVALTYPPARHYDLDFLDNSRTKGPCGMPKGKQFVESVLGVYLNIHAIGQ